ncbi:MAG: DUF2877 domain-containing protein [Anaerolineae bacterium]|nr:DUF2877 domain-containing protein [Anaerolineae bacterium]
MSAVSSGVHPRLIQARSISRVVWEHLGALPQFVSLLGCFERSIDLLAGEEVIALVTPQIDNGPFYIVVDRLPDKPLPEQIKADWYGQVLSLGEWTIDFSLPPPVWEPRVNWEEVALSRQSLACLRKLVQEDAKRRGCHSLFSAVVLGSVPPLAEELGKALSALDIDGVSFCAARIAGLGMGLTPAGDDFLAGVMLALQAYAALPAEQKRMLLQAVYTAAENRSTRLSRAYLKAAYEGMADAHWHRLLYSLTDGRETVLCKTVAEVLHFGETSGLDMANGFVWVFDVFEIPQPV